VPGLAAAHRAAHRITPGASEDRPWHHAHGLVTPGQPFPGSRLTATLTATAAAAGYQQRPAAAHNYRTIRADWGYVRPESGRSSCN
jgi:hypothetical protein